MKKFLALILAAMLLTANASAIDLYVDFERLDAQTPPTAVDGRTMVPVRAIFEALGAAVNWDAATKTATGTTAETTVVMQIDRPTAYVNGEAKTLDVPAQLINGSTMVPARFISEALGYDVTWYQPAQTAAIMYQLKEYAFYTSDNETFYHFAAECSGKLYRQATLAEAVGRGLLPCPECIPAGIAAMHTPSPEPDGATNTTNTTDTTTTTAPSGNETAASGNTQSAGSSGTSSGVGGSSTGNGNNFNTYDNESQQNTTAAYVLNTNTKKFHEPSCRSVKKIAPKNYSTCNGPKDTLISQGYSPCKICKP